MTTIDDHRPAPTREDFFGTLPRPPAPAATDLAGPRHQGLRRALARLLVRHGTPGRRPAAGDAEALEALRREIDLSATHPRRAEGRLPAGGMRDAGLSELALLVESIAAAPAAERPDWGRRLHRRFGHLVAEELARMEAEEAALLPLLLTMLTREEVAMLEARIPAVIPPAQARAVLALALPAMGMAERAALVARRGAGAAPLGLSSLLDLAADRRIGLRRRLPSAA